jgi:hypothetical protein
MSTPDIPATTPAPDHVNLIAFAFGREPWATWLRSGGCLESAHCELADLMLAVLARWGTPAAPPAPAPVVVPVAVAERLPGEGDCTQWPDDEDESCEPWCWQFTFDEDGWEVMQASKSRLTSPLLGPDGPSHWLPAHAIPLPQAGEVEP